jgi:hypothetical protein
MKEFHLLFSVNFTNASDEEGTPAISISFFFGK